jgi:hypothetical protein
MPKGDPNNILPLKYDPERMARTALDCALKDYRKVFGDELYFARLRRAVEAAEAFMGGKR